MPNLIKELLHNPINCNNNKTVWLSPLLPLLRMKRGIFLQRLPFPPVTPIRFTFQRLIGNGTEMLIANFMYRMGCGSTAKLKYSETFIPRPSTKFRDAAGPIMKCRALLFKTIRKIPQPSSPRFFWVRNWQVRDWVFHCNKKPESVINYILKVVYFD